MIFPPNSTNRFDAATVAQRTYDVVVVDAGISGAIIAYELSRHGKNMLVFEVGAGGDLTASGYQDYLYRFYSAAAKENQSPHPDNPNVPMPRSTHAHKTPAGITDA